MPIKQLRISIYENVDKRKLIEIEKAQEKRRCWRENKRNKSNERLKNVKKQSRVVFGVFVAKDCAPVCSVAESVISKKNRRHEKKVFQIIINSVRNFRGLKEWKFLQIRMNSEQEKHQQNDRKEGKREYTCTVKYTRNLMITDNKFSRE